MEGIGLVLLLSGVGFLLLASVGVLRFPDVLTRSQAATKVGAFGGGLTLFGAACLFGDAPTAARLFVILILLVVVSPIVSHLLARASYRLGIPLWSKTRMDELSQRISGESLDPAERARKLDEEIGS